MLCVEEIQKDWGQMFAEKKDEITKFLENPLQTIAPCSDSDNGTLDGLLEVRDKYLRSIELEKFACCILAAPLDKRKVATMINGERYEIEVNEREKLEKEIKHLKDTTVLGSMDQRLLGTFFVDTFKEAEEYLKSFMEKQATKAKEILLIFMGHGNVHESQGTMVFRGEKNEIKNEALFEAVKKHRVKDSLPGSAFSIVFSQCYSYVGIDKLPQEPPNLTVTALGKENQVHLTHNIRYVSEKADFHLPFKEDANLRNTFKYWFQTGNILCRLVTAKRLDLVESINQKYIIKKSTEMKEEKLTEEQPMETGTDDVSPVLTLNNQAL